MVEFAAGQFVVQCIISAMTEADVTSIDGDGKGTRRANPIDVHVGTRVRFRRMILGMSQERLGEKLGLTFQQVQKYEKGVNRIGASRIYEISKVLGVSVGFFFEEAPAGLLMLDQNGDNAGTPGFAEQPAETYAADFLSSREGLELNKAFARISDPKVRRTIVDLVRSLAGDDKKSGEDVTP